MQLIAYFVCFCCGLWKRLHENLFCSSPTFPQFPGRKRLIGSNVRPVSVSIPLFPCVNALPSKNTASLCIYCVRRWVLSFFLSPFYGYRNLVCSFHFSSSMSGIDVGPSEWANARAKWKKCEKDCLCIFFFFKETNACESWEEPVALCECERKKQVRVCP